VVRNDYFREYRKRNLERYHEQEALRRLSKKKYLDDIKISRGCSICGYNRCSAALGFHHLDPTTKKCSPSRLIAGNRSIQAIDKEIAKCIVICANCHMELHHGELELDNLNVSVV
jgi:hypothetical protein